MDDPPNELTLVTNSPAIAYEIQADAIHVVVAPGELDQHMRMLAGRWTVEFLSELNFAVAFFSAAGIGLDQGLTTSRRPLADVINAARAERGMQRRADRRDEVRRVVAALDRSRPGARCDSHGRRAPGGRRRGVPGRGRAARDRQSPAGESMSRPVTLFTGQWADLTLSDLAAKCGAWGFDGLELACWGDHFDVAAAMSDSSYVARAAQAARGPRARRLGDRQPPRRPDRGRSDRRRATRASSTRRSGATATPRASGSAPRSG